MMTRCVIVFCRLGLVSLFLVVCCFISTVCADSKFDKGSLEVPPKIALTDDSVDEEVDELLDSEIIDDTSDGDSSNDGIDDLDDSTDDSNTNVTPDSDQASSDGSDQASSDSMDYSLKITQPPNILSLVLCVPDHNKSIADTDYPAQRVLLGPLSRTQGRELIASIRSTRRPSSFNIKFFDFLKEQREAYKSIRTCCHTQHCDDSQYCHILLDAVSLAQGTLVGVCVPDNIDQ